MKRFSVFLAVSFALLGAQAAPVSVEQARTAVGTWLRRDSGLGCRLGRAISDAHTCTVPSGASVHVVRLSDGGFVITSSDTRREPILAFSSGADLVADARNPLWAMLSADISALSAAPGGSTALQSVSSSSASARWARLLAGGARLQSLKSVSDVCVAPLIKSKWGQAQNSMYSNCGTNCFNYYTPNNYACGCVATSLAQLMRYHRHPASITPVSRTCSVLGSSTRLTQMGGSYDYDHMKLVPEAYWGLSWYDGGATEEERAAIGKLTYDCAVAMQTSWVRDSSGAVNGGAGGAAAHGPLQTVFNYANARVAANGLSNAEYRERIICSNLAAGYPILLGIDGNDGGHAILADGYGYSDTVRYVHLNMGWSGYEDVWYALPEDSCSEASFAFSEVATAVYNIFPNKTGEIVSGRLLKANGSIAAGASVTVRWGANLVASGETDARGIFAFVVPADRTYTVSLHVDGSDLKVAAVVGQSKNSRVTLNVGFYSYYPSDPAAACGNVWLGNLALPPQVTQGLAVPVPYDWLDAHLPNGAGSSYEARAVADQDGDGCATWAEYLCGTDPNDAGDLPRCSIAMDGSRPRVTHNIVVPAAAAALGWTASLRGSNDLDTWSTATADAADFRFFKVVVEQGASGK